MSVPLRKIEEDLDFTTQVGSSMYGEYIEGPYFREEMVDEDQTVNPIYPTAGRVTINLTDSDIQEYLIYIVCKSPFEALVDKKTDSLFKEISRIKTDIEDKAYSQRLFSRIDSLVSSGLEDAPRRIPINPDSLHNFIDFVIKYPGLFYPSISINPSRYIHARWNIDKDHRLVMEFLPNKEILLYVSYKSVVRPFKTRRFTNKLLPEELIGTLAKLGLLESYTK